MSIENTQPNNVNMLSPTAFRFTLQRTPHINYFTYNVPVPSISLGELTQPTPLLNLPVPSDKLIFEPLALRFRVDEDLKNYLEIFNWLNTLGTPETLDNSAWKQNQQTYKSSGVFSDGTLLVLTSKQNMNLRIKFFDMFPINLTELTFDASLTDIEYLESTATFRYTHFEIETL